MDELLSLFPSRSKSSILCKAHALGLRKVLVSKEKRREYRQKYYREHREEILVKMKERYQRLRQNPIFIERRRELDRLWKRRNKKKLAPKNARRYRQRKQKIKERFGNECYICRLMGKKNSEQLCLHQIRGEKHVRSLHYYENNTLEDFVLLCKYHHKGAHFCLDIGMTWEEVLFSIIS